MRNATSGLCLVLLVQCSFAQTQDSANREALPPVVDAAPAAPGASERTNEYVRSLMNPFSLFTTGLRAGIGQWRDSPKEWGQGSEGYARRFGSSFGQHVAYATILYGASSLLGDDNRYVRSVQSGFGPRLEYALESTVLARHYDSAGHPHRRFSFSRVGALAGAVAISRIWQPRSTRSFRTAAASFGISMGVAGGFNVGREFLPGFPQ